MKRALVVGATGQIGEHCLAAVNGAGTYYTHARPGLIPLDITDVAAFDRVVAEQQPDVLYLAAYLPNVDYCEQYPDVTHVTNVGGIVNAVRVANHHGCKLVFLSSEYVFDGESGPYDETAAPKPLSVYGWQKLAAEHYIAAFARDWLIVRTTVVFSWESQGKNFVYRLRGTLERGERIKVPADQVSSPTYAPDLVHAMTALVEENKRGVFHVAGPRVVNRYEFAVAAAEAFDLDRDLIVPVTTAELKQAARRPLNAGLLVDKVQRVLGRPMPDFRDGLREMASALYTH
jgi:dTDP-4-dehydrorhamnose reductase